MGLNLHFVQVLFVLVNFSCKIGCNLVLTPVRFAYQRNFSLDIATLEAINTFLRMSLCTPFIF